MLSPHTSPSHINSTHKLYQSKLSPFNKDLCSGLSLNDTLPDTHHLVIYNVSLCALFTLAYGVLEKKIISHACFQVKSITPLEELFCYELRMPYQLRHQQALFMQQDLARRFPQYKVHLENQSVHEPLSPNLPVIAAQTEVLIITHVSVPPPNPSRGGG